MSLILYDGGLDKPQTQKIETDIFNYRSKELFINMNVNDIPPIGHPDRDAFIDWEEEKSILGVTVNGIFIPGSLYWDFCHWAIMREVKDSRGIKSKKPARPDIRDNDWLIHQGLEEAEQARRNLPLGTARQVSKSKNIASVFGRDLMLFDNRINLLMAGASNYLVPIMEYLFIGTENCTDFFRVPRLTRDKKAITYKWGFKTKEGEDIVKSMLHIRNAKEGQNTEVSAGVTIDRAAIDEIATFPFKSSYETIKPALIGEDGIRSSSIVAFTGGDVEKSKDAEEMFMNPNASGFNDYENEGKRTGFFMGGWYRQDLKVVKKLGEWLGVDDPNSELNMLNIRVTDFDHANKVLDKEEADAAKSSDPTAVIKHRMYNPRCISDMFLTPAKNPFPIDALLRHKEYLKDNFNPIPVDLFVDETGTVAWKTSSKPIINQYPVRDQNTDLNAPIVIYDFPKFTEHYALHVGGFDPVNSLDPNPQSDSLPSVYVVRRNHSDITDPYRNCIVASYTARPKSFRKEYLRNVELLQKFYNMQLLHEDSGNGITLYFDERNLSHVLMDTFNLQRAMNPNSKSNNTKGLKANVPNNNVRLEVLIAYLEEELGDGQLGLTRIPDPMLIEEFLAFDGMGEGSKNTDRIDAFSYALLQNTTLKKYNTTKPFLVHKTKEERVAPKIKRDAFGRLNVYNPKKNAFGF